MNALIILSVLVAAAAASNYYSGQGYVERDSTGNTVDVMGYDQNRDGLLDKADTNRDGYPDLGYGYGHGYGYGRGHGYGFNARHAYDRRGKTVPIMGKDQNNDGVEDYKDLNRDGKEDEHHYGYGNGYGYGYGHPGFAYGFGNH